MPDMIEFDEEEEDELLRVVKKNISEAKATFLNNNLKHAKMMEARIAEKIEKKMIVVVEKAEVQAIAKTTSLDGKKCGMVFHLTNAKRMLASAERIAAAGNYIAIGPSENDNYIQNVKTKRKIKLIKVGGVYELRAMVNCGMTWQEVNITIDSGAEECVMPRDWFPDAEWMPKKQGIQFMGADGSDIGNFGRRLIEFIPMEEFEGFRRPA
jgi:hypothetical protein